MISVIVKEAKDVAEYARRAEAWAASESRPPTDRTMAMAWTRVRGTLRVKDIVDLIERARTNRLVVTTERFVDLIEKAPKR